MIDVDDETFAAAVTDGIATVPDELMKMADNVAIFVEDEPGPDHADPALTDEENAGLLGMYLGTPLTERDTWWSAGSLPDQIVLFRGPLTRMCDSLDQLRDEVAVTIVHELAHHFGIEEERLHALGWG